MSDTSVYSERAVARRLRAEAAAERPEFSESLHRRAMSAIHQRREIEAHGPTTAASRDTTAGHHKLRLAVVLAAAAVLVAVAVGVLPSAPRGPAGASPIADSFPDLALLPDLSGRTEQGWNGLLAATGWTPQMENLQHDARLATEAMLSCLPHDIQVADNK